MVTSETLYISPISFWVNPCKDLISRISSSVSLGWCLLFRCLSRLLSAIVPRNRWSGFTHGGLSQVWQTAKAGSKSLIHCISNLWARCCRPSSWNIPYPSLSRIENSQQPLGPCLILEKNRSNGSFLYVPRFIIKYYNTKTGGVNHG